MLDFNGKSVETERNTYKGVRDCISHIGQDKLKTTLAMGEGDHPYATGQTPACPFFTVKNLIVLK